MQTWQVGDATITKIVELESVGDAELMLPAATPEAVEGIDWLYPHFMTRDGRLRTSIHSLVIETPERRILVDTALGNQKQGRPVDAWNNLDTPFLRRLAEAGFPAESIDTVLFTHLHMDHVGWNTRLVDGNWVPTFTNARHLVVREELDHWRADAETATDGMRRAYAAAFADSVRPVVEAGLVDLVGNRHQVGDGVRLAPTPGHTPGHVSIEITSRGERALITGDCIHHPAQLAHPEWTSHGDLDAAQAVRTRRELLSALADDRSLLIGTHFAGPTAGYVVRDGDSYRLHA
ncbi:MBL fold metallo-hydrolase [Micromonospora sp. WMMD812]|uniref:MBL fold metallo-hydrolase n=1 Tax=Micromonospora sp. WMMD812 TaxID=3015152 RepID=UPI00248BA222|nr:MBL fold metallo-hydrolase [Micromonospora sp. WMMD812]WBB68460.1 MBL fold metallo-hydrolase [Micromonospora sp. WMMD812]